MTRRRMRSARIVQEILGFFLTLLFYLPYVRRVRGKLPRGRRLYVANHVSLLDTLLLGGLFYTRRRVPILVLGDRPTWSKTWMHRMLAAKVGFLIDRGVPDKNLVHLLRDYGSKVEEANLIVFPEGTRGNGEALGEIQQGIVIIARAARVPVVPVFLENVASLSSKHGRFRPLRGLRSVTIHVGEEFTPNTRSRREFCSEIKARLEALDPRT